MIELKGVLNVSESISRFLAERRADLKLPSVSTGTQHARILHQERDASILYTWDDVAEWSEGAVVTHFGLYNSTTQKHQLMYTYNQRVNVASCSVNQERTLLAFTILSRDTGAASGTEKRTVKEVYTAYLAEIKAKNTRVFSLNLERSNFLKVQFLYGGQGSSSKESHMLVFLHRESIGLYHISLGRVGNQEMVMRGQPRTEQITKKFVWCQWDDQNQRLYYMHFRKQLDNDNKEPLLSCIQFYQNSQHDNILDVPLNFPFPSSKSSTRISLTNGAMHYGIPDVTFNACVLTHSNGTFCICYQHRQQVTSERKTKSSPLPRTSPLQRMSPMQRRSPYGSSPTGSLESDPPELNYYICMVHHAKTIHGCISGIPASVIKRANLHFSWHGDILLVMLPGYFIHLLNVSIEYEPCNHILLHNKTYGECLTSSLSSSPTEGSVSGTSASVDDTNSIPAAEKDSVLAVLSSEAEHLTNLSNTAVIGVLKDSPTSKSIFDIQSGMVWKVIVNHDSLLQSFTECYHSTTRLALLHYIVLRTRDPFLQKKLFEVLCNDIVSPEVTPLMEEYLICMTYASMRRQMDREVLGLLPFTTSEPFRGQFDKTADGERLARVSYSSLHSVNIGTKTAKERQQKRGSVGEDLWDTLRRHLRMMQIETCVRFSQDSVRQAYDKLLMEKNNAQIEQDTSFVTKIHRSYSSSDSTNVSPAVHGRRQRADTVLGSLPMFLQSSSTAESSEDLAKLTKELLYKHLSKYLKRDSRVKAPNVSKEYVTCQVQQARQLCHVLWSLRGPMLPYDDCEFLPRLTFADVVGVKKVCAECTLRTEPSYVEEFELFQLLERFAMALTELAYPLPDGFPSFFTTVAFRCIDLRLFLQYVDRGVLQLTGDFLAQVLSDIPDDENSVQIKHQLVSRLPQSSAEECYRKWGHPTCNRYLAHKQVADTLGVLQQRKPNRPDFQIGSDSQGTERRSSSESVTFQPLAAFLRLLENTEAEMGVQKFDIGSRRSPLDMLTLEEVALYHTRSETNYNMSTVNF